MPTIKSETLRTFALDLLLAGGFTRDDAEQTADMLIWANLRGVDSHGVLRIPRYVEMLTGGIVTTGGTIETVREFGAVTVLDGGKCPGAVGMNAAVDRAANIAERFGIGWCAVRRISHAGAVGYFTSSLAERGLIGIAMTASKPLMSYFGAKGEALSTNPLSIAVPRGEGREPIVLDMSTAAVALGKIMAAKDKGTKIPEGWAIDSDGAPATDPHKVAALLPMAGAKGSGLSLMIEILTSILAGNAVIGPVLTGLSNGGFNGMVLAVQPAAFGDPASFETEVERLANAIHQLDPVSGQARVLLPGERGALALQERLSGGILLAEGTAKRLRAAASELNVNIPPELAAQTT